APAVMVMGASLPAALDGLPAGADDVIEAVKPAPRPNPAASSTASAQAEALSALGNLGYGPSEAAQAVAQAAGEASEADTPTLIRAALKLLAPKG
ncbi:Holliday junction branch migration protein RuvA, partial [Escherichia coli]|nr:Holliday junction branch migration protein RuvA [Escherichia coli]